MLIKSLIKKVIYFIFGISFEQFMFNFIDFQMMTVTNKILSPTNQEWHKYFMENKDIQRYLWNMYDFKNLSQIKEVSQYFHDNIYLVYPVVTDIQYMWKVFCDLYTINMYNIDELDTLTRDEKDKFVDMIKSSNLSYETWKIKFFKWLNK